MNVRTRRQGRYYYDDREPRLLVTGQCAHTSQRAPPCRAGLRALCPALALALILLSGATAAPARSEPARSLATPPLISAPMEEIRKVQRLLALLAQRDPARFGHIHPGAVDGVMGARTARAIRDYKATVGLPSDLAVTSRLLLHLMSSVIDATLQSPGASDPGRVGAPPGVAGEERRARPQAGEAPAEQTLSRANPAAAPLARGSAAAGRTASRRHRLAGRALAPGVSAPQPPASGLAALDYLGSGMKAALVTPAPRRAGGAGPDPAPWQRLGPQARHAAEAFVMFLAVFGVSAGAAAGLRRSFRRGARRRKQRPGPATQAQVTVSERLMLRIRREYDKPELKRSRQLRDGLIFDVHAAAGAADRHLEGQGLAVAVHHRLRRMLEEEPLHYRNIFLSFLFLDRVGRAVQGNLLSYEQLDVGTLREIDLLRSYFFLHFLELRDKSRVTERMPGLFHLLQLQL